MEKKMKLGPDVEYDGRSFKLTDEYLASEEFNDHLNKLLFEVHSDIEPGCECGVCVKYRKDKDII